MRQTNRLVKISLVFCICICSICAFAQSHDLVQPYSEHYRPSWPKKNNIVSTKLDISFSFEKQILFGKEWLTVWPQNTTVSSIELDAKGLNIKNVQIYSGKKFKPLYYTSTAQQLIITLDRSYDRKDKYLLYIEYETKSASSTIGRQSALHFINPNGDQIGIPKQIWTSGQPENNSSWFPTIDKPNQKSTQELSITVPDGFQTLSNGKLIESKVVSKGLRKDTWKMELPHSPYLFMFAVGKFSIITDHWDGKEISYYIEPQFATDAQAVRNAFPNTVEAIEYFSKLLGVKYPWNKYSQIKLRGFNGAMENTTASAFNEDKQSSAMELLDKNYEPGNIHELFHQWFGNYVTAESWSNICLNESFADLSEIIWAEHKFGTDVSGDHLLKGMRTYFSNEEGWSKNLVRFDYGSPQEVFDDISYQKGGRILNMLRCYLGNETFYRGLNLYLVRHAFKSAEVHDLRLALEEVSGLDLNWFFNQWFFGHGHPELDITYGYDLFKEQNYVVIEQKQIGNLFTLPINIDVYFKDHKETKRVWLSRQCDTIILNSNESPLLINVDAQKSLIAKKTDHKSLTQFAFQYFNAPLFQDRYEAIEAAQSNQEDQNSRRILISALNDKFYGLRTCAIDVIDASSAFYLNAALPQIIRIANSDPNNSTRVSAIKKLGDLKDKKYLELFNNLLMHYSYAVKGEALSAIGKIDPQKQFEIAILHQNQAKGKFKEVILQSYISVGGDAQWQYVYDCYINGNSPFQYAFTRQLADFINRINNPLYVKQGIIALKERVTIQQELRLAPNIISFLNQIKIERIKLKDSVTVGIVNQSLVEINNMLIK